MPVYLQVTNSTTIDTHKKHGNIQRKQRRKRKIVQKAKEWYRTSMPDCFQRTERAVNIGTLEEAYGHYKGVMLAQRSSTRKKKPGRFKCFCIDNLDRIFKLRKQLLRHAMTRGTESAWEAYKEMDMILKKRSKE